MRHLLSKTAFAVLAAAVAVPEATAARPRGVGPEFAKFYQDTETFTCISDPSIKLPISQLNDDYCDCPDGSDEPGTSACSYLSYSAPSSPSNPTSKDTINASIALPGFYCKNKGHTPSYIPFTNINDGVCDSLLCCDGSDEWQGVGGIQCEDRCGPIGIQAKKHAAARLTALTAAGKARKQLVLDAARLRKEVESHLEILQEKIASSQLKVTQQEAELVSLEREEKGRVVRKSANAKNGKLGVLSTLAQQRTTELREALIKVKEERDASVSRIEELESILSTFKDDYNPNFNDEGVKRAVRAWEDYAARDKPALRDDLADKDLQETIKTDEENGIAWDDYNDEEQSETDLLYSFEAYLPPSLRGWLDSSLRSMRLSLIENGILPAPSTDGTESKAVTDARTRLVAAQDTLKTQQNEQQAKRDDLTKDYGSDDIFRALKGQCISKESGEYDYELCFLEGTKQKSRKSHGETRMGSFTRFGSLVVDEDLPADGRGVGSGERLTLHFENGQQCWNGPHRSTIAVIACAEKNELWKVIEEEKCIYRMDVGSPAACDVIGKKSTAGEASAESGLRDEL